MCMIDNKVQKFDLNADCYQQTGIRHVESNEECQDSVLCYTCFPISIYAIADGQSKKRFSASGGKLVLQYVSEYIAFHGIEKLSSLLYKDAIQYHILSGIRSLLHKEAEVHQTSIHEWASTIVLLAVDSTSGKYMIVHLGDGIIIGVTKDDNSLKTLSLPENGITSRSTWLTTSESALSHLRISFGSVEHYRRFIIASDGADSFFHGSNVLNRRKELLISGTRSDIGGFVNSTSHKDDCSVFIIDAYPHL